MGLLRNRCPRCGLGAVFGGLIRINTACEACGMSFEGDHSGARWLSYYVVLFTVVPLFVLLMVAEVRLVITISLCMVLALCVTPLAVRMSTMAVLRAEERTRRK